MTNVEALKACYVAIGGSAADVADVKTTAKVIEKISEIATPGGGGGGGESVFIPYEVDEEGVYSFTPKDLNEAFAANKTYYKAIAGDSMGTFTFAVQYMLDDGVYYLAFNTTGNVLDSTVQSEDYESPFVDTDW